MTKGGSVDSTDAILPRRPAKLNNLTGFTAMPRPLFPYHPMPTAINPWTASVLPPPDHPMTRRGMARTLVSAACDRSAGAAADMCGRQVAETTANRVMEDQRSGCKVGALPGWKRPLDLLCSGLSLPLMLPLMLLIGLWIKLVSRGPALLRQQRIGRNGKPFVLYKFRSMRMNCDTQQQSAYVRGLVASDCPMIKLDLLCDCGLISGGGMMRAAGLDELPQLFNVLRGDMSLVGPRPCLPEEYACFTPTQRERFNALPGLTGLWQVNGKNRSTFREMNAMDIHYVRNASARIDLQIVMRTPAALLCQVLLAIQQRHTVLRRQVLPPRAIAIPQADAGTGQGYAPGGQYQTP